MGRGLKNLRGWSTADLTLTRPWCWDFPGPLIRHGSSQPAVGCSWDPALRIATWLLSCPSAWAAWFLALAGDLHYCIGSTVSNETSCTFLGARNPSCLHAAAKTSSSSFSSFSPLCLYPNMQYIEGRQDKSDFWRINEQRRLIPYI